MNSGADEDTELGLRDRKKLRTRRLLIETALDLFSTKGFEETTLEQLTRAAEVSQRTFLRYFTSKEDVTLAPEKQFWAAFTADIGSRDLSGPVLPILQDTLKATLAAMGSEWERQFLTGRRLADETAPLSAHSLQFCAQTTRDIAATLNRRLSASQPGDLAVRVMLEIMIAAWHCAVQDWSAATGPTTRAALIRHIDRAFDAITPGLNLTAT